MLDSPRRGKRGPASSWKLGSTCAIRVPVVLANALVTLARRIDSGELTLADTVLSELDKQETHKSVAPSDDKKHAGAEPPPQKRALAAMRAEVHSSFTEVQASFAEVQASFTKARSEFIQNLKREKQPNGASDN